MLVINDIVLKINIFIMDNIYLPASLFNVNEFLFVVLVEEEAVSFLMGFTVVSSFDSGTDNNATGIETLF